MRASTGRRRTLWNIVLGALMVSAAMLPMAAAADGDKPPKHEGDLPAVKMYLEREGNNRVLVHEVDKHRGGNHEQTSIDLKKKGTDPFLYVVMGTWDTAPVEELTRVIDIQEAEIWFRSDGKETLKVQFLVEVLHNGIPVSFTESDCRTITGKPAQAQEFNLPAPFPAVEMQTSDVLSLRVSVRPGACVGGSTKGKLKLEYGSSVTPSNVEFAFGGPGQGGTTPTFEGPFVIIDGHIYITPQTVIKSQIFADPTLTSCSLILTFPDGSTFTQSGCAAGPIQITQIPASDPNLGTYKLHLIAIAPSGEQREETLEFFVVVTLP